MDDHVSKEDLILFKQILEKEFDNLILFVAKSGALEANASHNDSLEIIPEGIFKGVINKNSFPPILTHSLLITAYSFWEYSLKKICQLIVIDFPQYKNRISGFEKIHQYHSFLVDELRLKPETWETDLTRINIFRNIRNAIVHHHSYAGGNVTAQTIEFLRNGSGVVFDDTGTFRITKAVLVEDFIIISKRLIVSFLNEYIRSKNNH